MRTYKQLKEDFDIVNEINERQAETLKTISDILAKRNEEIAKLKIENRYMQRKINEYENYLDKNKGQLVKFYNRDIQC